MAIWDILLPFGTFCVHLVHFCGFGIMYQEKSGNLAPKLPKLGVGEKARRGRFISSKNILAD
jgi:hypothetical protein